MSEKETESLCFSCGRAYAKPLSAGGCYKILYGMPVCDEIITVKTEDGKSLPRVTKCQLWIPEGR